MALFRRSTAYQTVSCLSLLVACGSSGTKSGTGAPNSSLHAPAEHRSEAVVCSIDRGSGGSGAGGAAADGGAANTGGTGGQQCTGLNALYCHVAGYTDSSYCTFDACATDTNCVATDSTLASGLGTLGICWCSGNCGRNACIFGNCRTDADCKNGKYCSLSLTQCNPTYQCHTPDDECADNTDCDSDMACGYDRGTKHWGCSAKYTPDCPYPAP
jgi:hypothetical protein